MKNLGEMLCPGDRLIYDDDGITTVKREPIKLRKIAMSELDDSGKPLATEPECDWYITMYDPADFTPRRAYYNEVK